MRIPTYARIADALFYAGVKFFKLFAYPGVCNICGRPTLFAITDSNLRENAICVFCKSFNRSRQMCHVFSSRKKRGDIRIWNMENSGSFHAKLLKAYGADYIYSAYLGKGIESGREIQGVRHEDVRKTSFPSDHFDIILSSDVLEHVPNPEQAFAEIARILKPGGKFIFTVPFLADQDASDRRAIENERGEIVLLKEPQYHGDPLRPEGILVFTLFGWDLFDMARNAGLVCQVQQIHLLRYGIIGPGNLVFMAIKPGSRPGGA